MRDDHARLASGILDPPDFSVSDNTGLRRITKFFQLSRWRRRSSNPSIFPSHAGHASVSVGMDMISITEEAAAALRKLLAQKGAGPETGLRLAVRKGGCAGWQYEMKVANKEVGDHVEEFEGGRLIVAADSISKLAGCRVNYSDSLSDAGFRIENPNAARSCGCGTSFETAKEPTPEPEDCGKS